MLKSNNALDGALQFHLKMSRTEDGKYVASCPMQPQLPPHTADSASSAINGMRTKLYNWASTGKAESE